MTNRAYKTGISREQPSFLPPRIEDYVAPANMVRAIDAFVTGLRLEAFGFRNSGYEGGAGQPPYDPADLLRLYLYGYLNRIRSSRRLAQEAGRNVELMWLLKRLTPGYRTIAKFRKDNWAALKGVNRDFVMVLREAALMSAELVGIDGAFFDGDASKGSIKTRKRLAGELAALDREIEEYGRALESNDAAEARDAPPEGGAEGGEDIGAKVAALMEERARRQAELAQLEQSGQSQVSTTDADARLLSKRGQVVAGYNVQVAVDEKHKLIVASEVVNDGNDTGQLYRMAKAAKEALGTEALTVVADGGYYNGPELKACEEDGITAYVPIPERTERLAAQGRFTHADFVYEAAADVYRCPAGALLRPTQSPKINNGRREIVYLSRKSDCTACPLRARCLAPRGLTRTIYRWEHEAVIERHRLRMAEGATQMRRRACLAEHPFGTLKCRAGYRHFLVRGLDQVNGEWSLMALCYNFTRVLNILGFEAFMEWARKRANCAFLSAVALFKALIGSRRATVARFWAVPLRCRLAIAR